MAADAKLEVRDRNERTDRHRTRAHGSMILGSRVIRLLSRFREVARRDGSRVASIEPRGRSGRNWPLSLVLEVVARPPRCPYFTPPRDLDPYEAWLRVNRDNPRRRHADRGRPEAAAGRGRASRSSSPSTIRRSTYSGR